jgi:hypothetical protein
MHVVGCPCGPEHFAVDEAPRDSREVPRGLVARIFATDFNETLGFRDAACCACHSVCMGRFKRWFVQQQLPVLNLCRHV